MTETTGPREISARLSRYKSPEYKLYFAVVFAVSLPIAIARELIPRRFPDAQSGGPFASAKRMTNTVVPYIFTR